MKEELMKYLKTEARLLDELIDLAEKQQRMLVAFKLDELNDLTIIQENTTNELQKASNSRIMFTAKTLDIDEKDAQKLKLSDIELLFNLNSNADNIKSFFKEKTEKLRSLNLMNRLLTNRAKHSVEGMISIFGTEERKMCNARV